MKADDSYTDYAYNLIKTIEEKFGPRYSSSDAEREANLLVKEEFSKFCDETHQEPYTSSPHAFLGGIRYGALLVFIAGIFFWLSLLIDLNVINLNPIFDILFLIIAIVLIVVTISYFILEVMKYHELFDFIFPKKESKT